MSKRISRRLSSSEESDGDADSDSSRHKPNAKRIRIKKEVPSQASKASNRQRQPSSPQVASAKPKVIGSAQDDALRRFCLAKLEEILLKIFEEHGKEQSKSGEGDGTAEHVSESEQTNPTERAKAFATELEHCMMDRYSEPDKTGKMIAHNKYK